MLFLCGFLWFMSGLFWGQYFGALNNPAADAAIVLSRWVCLSICVGFTILAVIAFFLLPAGYSKVLLMLAFPVAPGISGLLGYVLGRKSYVVY